MRELEREAQWMRATLERLTRELEAKYAALPGVDSARVMHVRIDASRAVHATVTLRLAPIVELDLRGET